MLGRYFLLYLHVVNLHKHAAIYQLALLRLFFFPFLFSHSAFLLPFLLPVICLTFAKQCLRLHFLFLTRSQVAVRGFAANIDGGLSKWNYVKQRK